MSAAAVELAERGGGGGPRDGGGAIGGDSAAAAAPSGWRSVRGLLLMALSALCFSLMSLFAHLSGRGGAPSLQVVVFRCVVVGALSAGRLCRRPEPLLGPRESRRLLLARSVVGTVGLFAYVTAFVLLDLSDATVIIFTAPALTALAARVFLGERMPAADSAAAALSLAGVVMVARPRFLFGSPPDAPGGGAPPPPSSLGLAAAVLAAVSSCAVNILVRQLRGVSAPVIINAHNAVAAVAVLPAFFLSGQRWRQPGTAQQWACLLAVGAVGYCGQIAKTVGLQVEKAGPATMMRNLDILFAFGWQVLFLRDEPVKGLSVAGAAVVLACSLFVGVRKYRRGAAAAASRAYGRVGGRDDEDDGGGGGDEDEPQQAFTIDASSDDSGSESESDPDAAQLLS